MIKDKRASKNQTWKTLGPLLQTRLVLLISRHETWTCIQYPDFVPKKDLQDQDTGRKIKKLLSPLNS